jgi:hypothetical protein
MWKTIGLCWIAALSANAGELSEIPHPRLWLTREAEGPLREKLASDPLAAKLHASVMDQAKRILKERTCRYDIPDGKRLLYESRLALKNITFTAWAWRMGGGEDFRLRAITEMEAACALKDWNPSHFLDVGEMAAAVAIGYDWLYPTLTPKQRVMCETAIVEKALKPAKHVFDTGGWWSKPKNNWAQVCGGGIAVAAIAVAGKDSGLSEDLFASGLKLIDSCGAFYQPDGMYPEGTSYWHYGTNYHVMLLAACAALDLKFFSDPVLQKAGSAIMHLTSPARLPFNFADGHAKEETPTPAQCWLASHYKDPAQAKYVRGLFQRSFDEGKSKKSASRYSPLSILWLPADPGSGKSLPTAAVFRGEQAIALFRTGWNSKDAWLGIKGGTPDASHGHMDVGSFVYDAHGTRWIHDLGSDNYNMPSYFGDKRWNYFRLQNRSHNTLEIDGKLQQPESKPCPLVSSTITGNPYSAAFDLSAAYAGSASKVIRTANFDSVSGATRITDDITAPAGDVRWRAYTDADADVNGETVTLRKNGQHITLRRVSPDGKWNITSAKPPTAEENQNEGFRAIVLTVPKAEQLSVVVEIRP